MRYFYFLFFLLTLIGAQHSMAQRQQWISGDFKGMTFEQFVSSVEKQSSYHFYYKPAWTDSLSLTVTAEHQLLPEILTQVLKDTDLRFTIAANYSVFITKGREIMAELPPDFLNANKATRPAVTFDYSEYEKKEKQRKQVEAKLYTIGANTGNSEGNATLAGNVRDAKTGEPVIGAAIFVEHPMVGITTDQFGYYSLTLPKGRHEIKIQTVGMKSTSRLVLLRASGRLDIELDEDITPLKEVVVESDREALVLGLQMGMERLDIKTMKQIPLALGETDIMKVVLTLPGVQSVGEGTVGLNVRGGATNQNLILFNDAVVYNPSHMFGFFSTFNPDVLKNVELYKSGIAAEYGGRLSSVLDVHSREGNAKKFTGSGGISPITGRLTLEGPIIKDKTSFIIGARSTYSGWLLKQINSKELNNSKASFYDLTANITHKINDNNNLYLSAYFSKDRFKLHSDTSYSYSDQNASFKWKHIFNNKLYGVLTSGYSHYTYQVESNQNPVNGLIMNFKIGQLNSKADFSYFPNPKHTINAGVSTTRYDLSPGNLEPYSAESLIVPDKLQHEQGLESAAYISENYEINPKLSLYLGVRYSFYQYLGSRDVVEYAPNLSRDPANAIDTIHYGSGKTISRYHGPEPRFSIRYLVSKSSSVKFSYNRMRQYIQMLSNTTAINPTDIWKLSGPYIKPQVGDQFSVGFYRYLKGNIIEASLETYYKMTESTIDYKNGAVLLLNHHLETDVLDAKGKAYGVEFMLKKSSGKLNGWVSYAYSRSFLQTKGKYSNETINHGEYYPSNYDKPHAVNFIGNYKFSRRFNFSLNVIYSTGRPITLPIAKYTVDGNSRVYYSDRNQYRIPDYFRTDISVNVEGNHKIKKLAHSSWTFAVYNLLGRANAYSVFFVSEKGRINGYKLSIFARPIPTITYNFKF
jgi:hypothetical protein